VIAPVEDNRVVCQPVLLELSHDVADLAVHIGNVVVHARELFTHGGRVRVVRRDLERGLIGDELLSASRRTRRENAAFVRDFEVEHREEWLVLVLAIAPVRVRAEIVPDGEGHAELVIGLGAIAREVSGGAEVLRKRFHIERRHRQVRTGELRHPVFGRPHVMRADRRLIHAGDDGCATGRADRRGRERVGEANRFTSQTIERRGTRNRVAVRSKPRAHVLVGDPDDVGTDWPANRRLRRRPGGTRDRDDDEEYRRRELPAHALWSAGHTARHRADRGGGCDEPRLLEQPSQLRLHVLESFARIGPVDDVDLFVRIDFEIIEFIHAA
jgi:hypothetical protein